VPRPATGNTALRTGFGGIEVVLIALEFGYPGWRDGGGRASALSCT
jgi:hypothetical protein